MFEYRRLRVESVMRERSKQAKGRSYAIAALVSAAAVIGTVLLAACNPADPTASPSEPITVQLFKDPTPVPDVAFETIDGRRLTLRDFGGKVVLVNFWATWCGPCRAEIPDLVALQRKYGDQLQIIGISEDEGGADVVKPFTSRYAVNYPIVMATPELHRVFPGVTALPTTFVIDREANVVQKHVGLVNISTVEKETRVLAGLVANAAIERVDRFRRVGLENEAQAMAIPGIDLEPLSPEQRVQTLVRLNGEPCTCGCELSLAKCRIDDPACGVSLPLARRIVGEIASQAASRP